VCARHPELAAPLAFVKYLFIPILPGTFQVGCTQPVPYPDLGNCSRKALSGKNFWGAGGIIECFN
jgi:hypothetical protein